MPMCDKDAMATKKHILCTGGAGYIGSHTVILLLKAGYEVTILDSLVNAQAAVLDRLEEICERKIPFVDVDLCNKEAVQKVFKDNKFDGVIHYAGLKAVGESVAQPLQYYRNNLLGTLNLLEVMRDVDCRILVFSSSATVYQPKDTPLKENDPLGPSNPYGQTKFFIEQILRDVAMAEPHWYISILRYFNPVGAHASGRIGESPEMPMNLLPYIQQVAVGRRPALRVFGNDWPTRDGTGIRDYLHVEDLAEGHIAALRKLLERRASNPAESVCITHNLGTGRGVSVLEMAKLFEKASGVEIPIEIVERRPGDLATVVADVSKAKEELNWCATRTIEEACSTAWNWQSKNPNGY